MDESKLNKYLSLYKNTLLNDIIPFWVKHSPDEVFGGFYHYLDRDGSILSTDKSVWIQGRSTWLFSRLYNTFEKRDEWLQLACSGYEFLKNHCFDIDGRMFFQTTCDGRPLRKRRYWFSETFAVIAFAEYAKASGDEEALFRTKELYAKIVEYFLNPQMFEPKVIPDTRSMKSHAYPMIMIATTQIMRETYDDPIHEQIIDRCIKEIFEHFVDREKGALLENVGLKGEFIDIPFGRLINPGHAIETSWFLMHEGLGRKDGKIIRGALEILNWSFERGWDKEYGGLFSFVDIDKKPPEPVEWDMKYWWPHTEAMYALLLATSITSEKKYEIMYERVHEWSFEHFPDHEYGEWYGYLHRDGSLSSPVKGSAWKGPFHISRFLMYGISLMEDMINL